MNGKLMLAALAVAFALSPATAEWKPEYAQLPQAERDFFQSAELTPEAQRHFGWQKCCNHADRVMAKFIPGRGRDEWSYVPLDNPGADPRVIPPMIVHDDYPEDMPQQLRVDGVLFVYGGRETCFWPPQSGG